MMFPWHHGLTLRRGEGGTRLWKKGEGVISGHGNSSQGEPIDKTSVLTRHGGICPQTNGKLMMMNESVTQDKVVGCQAQQHLHHRCRVPGSPSPPVTHHRSHVFTVLIQPLCVYFKAGLRRFNSRKKTVFSNHYAISVISPILVQGSNYWV